MVPHPACTINFLITVLAAMKVLAANGSISRAGADNLGVCVVIAGQWGF